MPFRLALAVLALVAVCANSAYAQGTTLYYCDPLRLYYDPVRYPPTTVPACPVPWRIVGPAAPVAPSAPMMAQPMRPVAAGQSVTPTGEADQTDAYRQGVADWRALQAWFGSQTGDRRAGADYWAANRSVAKHAQCAAAAMGNKSEFIAGCEDAKQRLSPIDNRRHSDSEYRVGFSDEAKRLPISKDTFNTADIPYSAGDLKKHSLDSSAAYSPVTPSEPGSMADEQRSSPRATVITSEQRVHEEPAATRPSSSGNWFLFAIICIIALYFLPTIIAAKKGRGAATFVANLFFGWTFFGWIVILIWALTPGSNR